VRRLVTVCCLLIIAATAFPAQTRAADDSGVNSLGLDASYDVNATFDWRGGKADVRTIATVNGSKPWSSSALAFNLQILRIGHAQLTTATVDGAPVVAQTDDQTIIVPLDPPLAPGGSIEVELDYTATMTNSPNPNGDNWGFAATGAYLTGYRWIPWLSKPTKFDRPSVGDPYVTANASDVKVAITADPSLIFATSGVQTASDGSTRHYEAHNVRDFNFAASPFYRTASRTVRGINVTVFYNSLDAGVMLDVTSRAINDYSDKVGAYAYPTLNIAETGPWASIESPGLSWVADNVPGHLLAWTTAHEVAHEWFYAAVGNDQALEPFADEALVDFMARNLLNRFVPSQCPAGWLDSTIYELGDCYPWVIYVQGNLWLKAYRDQVGSATFWRGVADYYAENKFGIGGTLKLLNALDAAAGKPQLHERFPSLYAVPVPCLPFG
jgi:hypothetical protein